MGVKNKYNEGDEVTFNERTPLWFQEQHTPETIGIIVKKEGTNYLIKIKNTENEFVKFPSSYIKKSQKIWRFK